MADRGDSTRARILDEGLRLASRDGLEGLSIGTLAAALGLSKSGLFAHFGSKDALQVAVLEHAAAQVQARMAPALDIPPGPERLRFLFRSTLDWIDDPARPGGCPITGACIEFDDREGPVRAALEQLQRRTQERIAGQFEAFRHPDRDPGQLAFEYRGLTLAYHHAARMLRAEQARSWALAGLEDLIAKAGRPA